MKNIIQYINEWGGEKMRKPSMKFQLEMLRKALKENEDAELALDLGYVITDIIYNGKELEITVSSDENAEREIEINTVKDLLAVENGAVMKCKKITWIEKFDSFYLDDTYVQDNTLYLELAL
jgi:hypothetical protein